mmetsp:Transcript_28404/g.84781  ORF Transcript_28404/g.84781 Transcript_28404/m.84781 type:complete len:232 (+) Transcript_28404:666-1361(+)
MDVGGLEPLLGRHPGPPLAAAAPRRLAERGHDVVVLADDAIAAHAAAIPIDAWLKAEVDPWRLERTESGRTRQVPAWRRRRRRRLVTAAHRALRLPVPVRRAAALASAARLLAALLPLCAPAAASRNGTALRPRRVRGSLTLRIAARRGVPAHVEVLRAQPVHHSQSLRLKSRRRAVLEARHIVWGALPLEGREVARAQGPRHAVGRGCVVSQKGADRRGHLFLKAKHLHV